MPPIIAELLSAFLKGKELITKIDEGGSFALAAQLEFEQATVEGEGLLDVSHLERDVVHADGASLAGCDHGGCLEYLPRRYVVAALLSGNADGPMMTEGEKPWA
jgi:hypothetical protein